MQQQSATVPQNGQVTRQEYSEQLCSHGRWSSEGPFSLEHIMAPATPSIFTFSLLPPSSSFTLLSRNCFFLPTVTYLFSRRLFTHYAFCLFSSFPCLSQSLFQHIYPSLSSSTSISVNLHGFPRFPHSWDKLASQNKIIHLLIKQLNY